MHEVIGSSLAVIHFFDILNFLFIWPKSGIYQVYYDMSLVYPWIYVLDNVYTWLNVVQTCIHSVYTFNILYIIVYTCNIQGHTMYIRVYTMYMSLCLEYKFSWQEQSELFFQFTSHRQAIWAHVKWCQAINLSETMLLYNYWNFGTRRFIHYKWRYSLPISGGKLSRHF